MFKSSVCNCTCVGTRRTLKYSPVLECVAGTVLGAEHYVPQLPRPETYVVLRRAIEGHGSVWFGGIGGTCARCGCRMAVLSHGSAWVSLGEAVFLGRFGCPVFSFMHPALSPGRLSKHLVVKLHLGGLWAL